MTRVISHEHMVLGYGLNTQLNTECWWLRTEGWCQRLTANLLEHAHKCA